MYGYHRLSENLVYPVVQVDIESEFLTEAYFSELSEQFTQIQSAHQSRHIFDHSKAFAAHAILTRMMLDFRNNPEALPGHNQFDLFFETFDRNVKKLAYITKEIHYFRNELNRYGGAPEQLDDMIELAACDQWRTFSARYHRYEVTEQDAAYHVKFVSADGRFEVVYHTETGQIVTDPINMGTYNYAPGSIIPWKYYQHHKYDKVPWMKWGNTEQVSYKEIKQKQTRNGTIEQKNSSKKLEESIKKKMSESPACQP